MFETLRNQRNADEATAPTAEGDRACEPLASCAAGEFTHTPARCGPTPPARPAPSAPSSLTSAPRAALSVSGQARAFLSILHQVKVSFLLLGGDGFFDEDRDPTTPCTVREEMPASPPRLT